ncbi:MAG: type II secretion system F family protein [Paracoccaceae bacterium]
MQNLINSVLGDTLGPFGPIIIVGALGLILILLMLPLLMRKQVDPMDKLRDEVRGKKKPTKDEEVALRTGTKNDKLEKYSNFLEPQNAEDYSAIKLKLVQAGYRGPNSVRMFHFAQFSLGLGLLAVGIVLALLKQANGDPTTQVLMMYVLIPGGIGYMLPKYWITRRVEARKEEIVYGFPDSLDMMLVCVEAGQSLDQSIIRVAKEIRAGFPALADEFQIVSNEMKAGKDKVTVLRDMAERCGVPDVASFVTVLIQSASFGTSISEALRVYAGEMRDKRVMRAEEKANTLPTKMTLATMMLTVPPLLIILIGPSVWGIYTMLSGETPF